MCIYNISCNNYINSTIVYQTNTINPYQPAPIGNFFSQTKLGTNMKDDGNNVSIMAKSRKVKHKRCIFKTQFNNLTTIFNIIFYFERS